MTHCAPAVVSPFRPVRPLLHPVRGFPRQPAPGGFPPRPLYPRKLPAPAPKPTRTVSTSAFSLPTHRDRSRLRLPATDPSSLGLSRTAVPGTLHPGFPPELVLLWGLPTSGDQRRGHRWNARTRAAQSFVCVGTLPASIPTLLIPVFTAILLPLHPVLSRGQRVMLGACWLFPRISWEFVHECQTSCLAHSTSGLSHPAPPTPLPP